MFSSLDFCFSCCEKRKKELKGYGDDGEFDRIGEPDSESVYCAR